MKKFPTISGKCSIALWILQVEFEALIFDSEFRRFCAFGLQVHKRRKTVRRVRRSGRMGAQVNFYLRTLELPRPPILEALLKKIDDSHTKTYTVAYTVQKWERWKACGNQRSARSDVCSSWPSPRNHNRMKQSNWSWIQLRRRLDLR